METQGEEAARRRFAFFVPILRRLLAPTTCLLWSVSRPIHLSRPPHHPRRGEKARQQAGPTCGVPSA
ncbi:MAG: hypothetical protein OT477_07330, partial [Chloroflexi bacterium]|nr:hypothetical protein [Chloroflexota bacterium]